jgi:glycosyltransferase involved in cell wall biosynthesis
VRILVISNLYPDTKQPTFGTFVATHVAALRRAGAEVSLAAIMGFQVHRSIGPKYVRLAARALLMAVRDALRGRRHHVVEAHIAFPTSAIAWPIARLVGARFVVYCHGSDVSEVSMRSGRHRALAGFLFRRADLLIVNSGHTAAVVAANFGISGAKVIQLSPGIDTDIFRADPAASRDPASVVFVGRLDPNKGIDVLIDAVATIGNDAINLSVIGTGPERERLEQRARRLGVSAQFLGGLLPAEVAGRMSCATVLAVPSQVAEGLGLVALEGMASGAMVVASATGGLAESVEPGVNGWLVPRGDASALAAAITEALAAGNGEAGHEIRKNAAARAAEHDVYEMGRRAVALYSAGSGRAAGAQ